MKSSGAVRCFNPELPGGQRWEGVCQKWLRGPFLGEGERTVGVQSVHGPKKSSIHHLCGVDIKQGQAYISLN